MKHMKKLLVVLIAIAIVATMSAAAFAAGSVSLTKVDEKNVSINAIGAIGMKSFDFIITADDGIVLKNVKPSASANDTAAADNAFTTDKNMAEGKFSGYFKYDLWEKDAWITAAEDIGESISDSFDPTNFNMGTIFFDASAATGPAYIYVKGAMVIGDSSVAVDEKVLVVGGEPATEPSVSEHPATEAPVSEHPATEAPVSEHPATEAPVSEHPATEAPVSEHPATEAPVSEHPVTEAPVSEHPVTEAPVSEHPASETPASEHPASEEPASEQPASEQPASEKPASEKPASEKPTKSDEKTTKGDKTPAKTPSTTKKPVQVDGGVNTGDNMALAAAFGVVALAGAAFILTKKRK